MNSLIGLVKRILVNLPGNVLLTIYKPLIRPHLNYDVILYDKPNNNETFQSKIEKVQYEAFLSITGTLQGTSKEKILY